ncbi:MAG: hypothetical protein M3N19_00390 [Candidatus Eremiobacteraeota bacterium]|nr:hypothetical protein [Candidatus Eremiobacteraeota bacterium]
MIILRITAIFAALAACAVPQLSLAANPAPLHVIVAKDSRDPVLIWQASRELYSMMGDGASDTEINTALSRGAVKAAAASLKKVSSTNGTLLLKIMYNKMAANGLNYQVFTLANAYEYAELQMSIKDARHNRDHWMSLRDQAKLPAWIHFRVVGKLPGR